MTHAWFDVSAGVAGDMMLGALLDAGAPLAGVQDALDALVPGSVRLEVETVLRGGQRGTKAKVRVLVDDPPHRTWAGIRDALTAAPLPEVTRDRSLAVFGRLADAEARAHGIAAEDVHFHEVGALDSIADVVGTCEALRLLGVETVSASPMALGSGRVRTAHGDIPVPVPAVAELVKGWRTVAPTAFGAAVATGGHDHPHTHAPDRSPSSARDYEHGHGHRHDHDHHQHDTPAAVTTPGEPGELATPTGAALVRALAVRCEALGALSVTGMGVGAGGRDFATHPNVVRVVLGQESQTPSGLGMMDATTATGMVELRANVDDLDPRVWPAVIDVCLAAGAVDAWLVPIVMKKGRPAHTLHALAAPDVASAVADVMLSHTTTLGVRYSPVGRVVLDRTFATLEVDGEPLSVKVASRDGVVVHAAAEFDSLVAVAARLGRPQAEVAQRAAAAIVAAGLMAGARG